MEATLHAASRLMKQYCQSEWSRAYKLCLSVVTATQLRRQPWLQGTTSGIRVSGIARYTFPDCRCTAAVVVRPFSEAIPAYPENDLGPKTPNP